MLIATGSSDPQRKQSSARVLQCSAHTCCLSHPRGLLYTREGRIVRVVCPIGVVVVVLGPRVKANVKPRDAAAFGIDPHLRHTSITSHLGIEYKIVTRY